MNVTKEAQRDAREYARAQMYYGEGAGTRRKLITNSVAAKVERKIGYNEAFQKELERQDMAEHALRARKERRRKDVSHSVNKNTRNLVTGNYRGVNTSIMVIAGVVYFAHQTGYDVKIYDSAKKKIDQFRAKRWARKVNLASV